LREKAGNKLKWRFAGHILHRADFTDKGIKSYVMKVIAEYSRYNEKERFMALKKLEECADEILEGVNVRKEFSRKGK